MTLHTVRTQQAGVPHRPVYSLEIRCERDADRELLERFAEACEGHDPAARLTTMLDLLDQLEGKHGH